MNLTEKDLTKYNHIENLILDCVLGKSNISKEPQSYDLLHNRLTNLKVYTDSIIKNIELNILIHNRINHILNNINLINLYGRFKDK